MLPCADRSLGRNRSKSLPMVREKWSIHSLPVHVSIMLAYPSNKKIGWSFYTNFSPPKTRYYSFFWGKNIIETQPNPLGGPPLVSTWMEVSRPCCYSLGSSIAPGKAARGFLRIWIWAKFSLLGWLVTDPFEQYARQKKMFETSSYNSQTENTGFFRFFTKSPPFFEVAEVVFCPEWINENVNANKTDHEDHDVEYDDAYRSDWFGYCDDNYPFSTV